MASASPIPVVVPDLWTEAAACTGADTVFIVGSPRSGTTWLQRLLASHPRVKTGQESHLFSFYLAPQLKRWQQAARQAAAPDFNGRNGLGLGGYLSEDAFLTLLRQYVVLMQEAAGVQSGNRFLEKSPSHSLVMPAIRTVLPQSRFIHLVRDPRDVVASLLAASATWGKGWAPETAAGAAATWMKHVNAVERAREHLGPEQFTEIRYEDLHRDTPGHVARLAAFMGLEWDEAAIAEAVDRNSAERARKGEGTALPVFGHHGKQAETVEEPSGFVRRARPGGGRSLSLRQKWAIWKHARVPMRRYGYDWERTDWL